jgi:hypothetical protein
MNDENNNNNNDEKVEEFVTAYRISKMLEAKGVVRKPQQMYRYVDQKLIASVVVDGQKLVRLSVAEAFVEKFVAKHGSKKVDLTK